MYQITVTVEETTYVTAEEVVEMVAGALERARLDGYFEVIKIEPVMK